MIVVVAEFVVDFVSVTFVAVVVAKSVGLKCCAFVEPLENLVEESPSTDVLCCCCCCCCLSLESG